MALAFACSSSSDNGGGSGGSSPGFGGSTIGSGGSGTSSGGSSVGTGGAVNPLGGAPATSGGAPALGGAPAQGGSGVWLGGGAGRGSGGSAGGPSRGGAPGSGGSSAGSGPGGAPAAGGTPGGGGATPLAKFVGNITTGYNNGMDQGTRKYATYWDQVTPENAGKWGSVQSNASSAFNWSGLDSIYAYTQDNKIIFKQHCFLWGSQQPSGSIDEAAVKKWMTEFCKRFPETKLIDVVNEPPPHTNPGYASAIGGNNGGDWKWIVNAFTWAREACPNAILILNDYNNIEWTNDHNHFIEIVKALQKANAPIDAVGAQAHDLDNSGVQWSNVQKMIEDLHTQTNLPVYITEYDISNADDNGQLNTYKQQFPFFLSTEYIKGVTIWGWIYGQTWDQAKDSGLIKNGSPRPAMTWLMEQLKRPAP